MMARALTVTVPVTAPLVELEARVALALAKGCPGHWRSARQLRLRLAQQEEYYGTQDAIGCWQYHWH